MTALTDDQFNCWLAGFFDGEGCVYLNPKALRSAEVSIASTNPLAIDMIKTRLQIGVVTRIEYSNPRWKDKYHWRVRNYRDIITVLNRIRPYLFIKAQDADLALIRTNQVAEEREDRRTRNAKIIEMSNSGMKDREIAVRVGVSRSLVGMIRSGGLKVTDCPGRDASFIRHYKGQDDTVKHKSFGVTTKSTIL